MLSLEEQKPGSQEPQAFVLAIKPALHSTGVRVCLFILLGLEGDPDPWPGELGEWAVCSKSFAVPHPVMGVKRGPHDDSLEVSRLTLLILQNVRLT